jgi:hypothetical protein
MLASKSHWLGNLEHDTSLLIIPYKQDITTCKGGEKKDDSIIMYGGDKTKQTRLVEC